VIEEHCLLWDFVCYFIINCLIIFTFIGYSLWARRSDICIQFSSREYIWRVCSSCSIFICVLRDFYLQQVVCVLCFMYGRFINFTVVIIVNQTWKWLLKRWCRYKVGCDLPGKYRVALDSDAWEFGGHGRVRSPNLSGSKYEYIQTMVGPRGMPPCHSQNCSEISIDLPLSFYF